MTTWMQRGVNVLLVLALGFGAVAGMVFATPHALAAPASAQPPLVVYRGNMRFKADGVAHRFTYPILCGNGKPGCFVQITVTGRKVSVAHGADSTTVTPYDPPEYYDVTDDYKTCTGAFRNCNWGFTEAKLYSRFEILDGSVDDVLNSQRWCGAQNWYCVTPLGPIDIFYDPQGAGSGESRYGPQVYNDTGGGGSQTKYAAIIMYGNGTYTFNNSCAGYLC